MIKVLFFTGVPIDDAATLYRSGLVAKKLAGLGYQVIFTSVSANFKGQEVKKVSGLSVLFIGQAHYQAKQPFSTRERLGLGKTLVENIKTCFRFPRILREEKPDKVLVVTAMPISLMVGLVSKILGFKTFLDIEDLVVGQMKASGYPKFLVGVYDFLEKNWVKIFDKVIVPSRYLAKRYKCSVILPNMIEMVFWAPLRSKSFAGQARLVFVGQMGPYHGQMEVLESLTPVLRKNKNLRLIFVGGGEKLESLKLKVSSFAKASKDKEKLKRQVVFTGQVSQNRVREILASSDIGILPLWDTPVHQARHPLKLLEYLSAGLVVVTNKVGEAAQIIRDGENGILCPPGDMECLAGKVEMVLENPDLAQKITQNAVVSAQEFSSEKILPKWTRFLE